MDDLANQVKSTNFHATHDNINRMFRVLHQRADHNSHFDSGTAVTVFLPPNEADFQLPETDKEFLRQAAKGTQTPITPHEIQELRANAAPQFFAQNVYMILNMLMNALGVGFYTYKQLNSKVFN